MGEEVGPESLESAMTLANLEGLRGLYYIPEEFGLILVSSSDRVCFSPTGNIEVYEKPLKAGLHFPLHPFIKRILERFSLGLAQIARNSWRHIVGFIYLCNLIGVRPTMGLFWSCYVLKRHPSGEGWWYFSLRSLQKVVLRVPSSIHEWKGRYFFVTSEKPWGMEALW